MTLKRTNSGEIYFGEAKWNPWGTIDCLVQLEDNDEVLSFHATPDDEMDYGRELFEMLSTKYRAQVTACSEEERYAAFSNEARGDRDYLLKKCDWTQGADVPEGTKNNWIEYRQALRDVPTQEGFPYEVIWPEVPT